MFRFHHAKSETSVAILYGFRLPTKERFILLFETFAGSSEETSCLIREEEEKFSWERETRKKGAVPTCHET